MSTNHLVNHIVSVEDLIAGAGTVTSVTVSSPGGTIAVTNGTIDTSGTIEIDLADPAIVGTIKIGTAGKGLFIKEGANATMGTLTLNGATEVTVATNKVTATSRIFLTVQAPGGTPAGVAYVSSRSAGVSFGVKGIALDTSTVAWVIIEPA